MKKRPDFEWDIGKASFELSAPATGGKEKNI